MRIKDKSIHPLSAAVLIFLLIIPYSYGENAGRAYYDLGIFAYEEGDLDGAQKNFEKALSLEADQPDYHYYLGKTLMKKKQYPEAKAQFDIVRKQKADMPGLKYDMALTLYKMSDYEAAAALFTELSDMEPPAPGVFFYSGMSYFKQENYDKALQGFLSASEKNPGVRDNADYYAAICFLKTGQTDTAREKFEYVRNNARSEVMKNYADRWLQALDKQKKAAGPFRAYLKLSYQYDDNVRLEALDADVYSDEEDYVGKFHGSFNYRFFSRDRFQATAGYSHYQTWHNDLDEYDLTGNIFTLNTKYVFSDVTFGLSYNPTYYWLDQDSFLLRHRFSPETIWRFGKKAYARMSYSYYRNKYFDDSDKNGHSNEISLNASYPLGEKMNILAGVSYEDFTASHPDEYYEQWKYRIGLSLDAFWDIKMNLSGRYSDKKYDNADSDFAFRRKGKKYYGGLSISRNIYDDWLGGILECDFTKNDSNNADYDYERFTTTLSVRVSY